MSTRVDIDRPQVSLGSLFWAFLKIGSTSWGGFMALISVVQTTVVEQRRLLSAEEMLDGISLATLLPGPVAVNVVAYVGYRARGGSGALVSVVAVILPSFLLVVGLAMAYFRWGEMPVITKVFAGFVPAVMAIILNAAWGMRKKALKGPPEILIAIIAAGLLLGLGGYYLTIGIIVASGLVGWVLYRDVDESPDDAVALKPAGTGLNSSLFLAVLLLALFAVLFLVPVPWMGQYPGAHLFTVFSGMSLMLFGGGFVFIPLIQEIVVEGLHWLNRVEFTTAIALGQVTPGPILISAAFIGYKVWGVLGALIATVGIFFPSALLMVTASRMLDRIKGSAAIQAMLRGIRAAVIGLIATAAIVIGQTAELHWASPLIFLIALLALLQLKLDVIWIIPSAGLLGLLMY